MLKSRKSGELFGLIERNQTKSDFFFSENTPHFFLRIFPSRREELRSRMTRCEDLEKEQLQLRQELSRATEARR